jgi:hypothetical protein
VNFAESAKCAKDAEAALFVEVDRFFIFLGLGMSSESSPIGATKEKAIPEITTTLLRKFVGR